MSPDDEFAEDVRNNGWALADVSDHKPPFQYTIGLMETSRHPEFTRDEYLPIPYWRIETGGIRGGLLQRPAAPPPPACGTNAYVCSIEVADIDAVADKILSLGGKVALPKFAVPGMCWQAYFLDPDGNTFGVFQPDSAAK